MNEKKLNERAETIGKKLIGEANPTPENPADLVRDALESDGRDLARKMNKAMYILHQSGRRDPEVERLIAQCVHRKKGLIAFHYAKSVINGRWPEMEREILSSPAADMYRDLPGVPES